MARVAVIGAGAMGLAAAFHACRAGHDVHVFEAGPVAGGQAAHFDFGGLSLERFYHFICRSDLATFDLLQELGIAGQLRWRDTSMGYFIDGRHYKWGEPFALLKFPLLSLLEKLRFGWQMFKATRRRDWSALDQITARQWLEQGSGKRVYELLWRDLMDRKFHQHADQISAAWMWTRIKRLGTSRRSLFQEELGYLEGGTETLVQALMRSIEQAGGQVHLSAPVQEIKVTRGSVTSVMVGDTAYPVDEVISTVPTPFVSRMIPSLSEAARIAYEQITNIGVVCVVVKLKRSITNHFWVNITGPGQILPGIVEFSRLRPLDHTIVYAPFYMPPDNPDFARPDSWFIEHTTNCLKQLNARVVDTDIVDVRVARLKHAQPVCDPGFGGRLPPVQTEITGLQIADTCFYYPEDRGISESVKIGRLMATNIA